MKVFLDGNIVDAQDAKVSIFDHGYLYGNGVFTTLMTLNGQVFFLDDHIERLIESAQIINLELPWTKEQLAKWTMELYEANMPMEGRQRIRINVSRGVGSDVIIEKAQSCRPLLSIFVTPYPEMEKDKRENGVSALTVNLERVFPDSKNFNFLPSIFALEEARNQGFDDALFTNRQGHLTEATTGNLFFFKDDKLYTTSSQILKGITRKHVIHVAKEQGIQVIEKMFTLGEMLSGDEIFLSGTTKLILPVNKVNDHVINEGKAGVKTMALKEKMEVYLQTLLKD